jgi:hypothetical protein
MEFGCLSTLASRVMHIAAEYEMRTFRLDESLVDTKLLCTSTGK